MKKYTTCSALLFFGFMFQTFAQVGLLGANQQPLEHSSIKDELLHLYITESQLCQPCFSSKAHTMLELQKIPSNGFWSWVINYMNSYVHQSYFRVTPEKAPQTIAYLKTITEKMGIDHVPDLYLTQNSWNSYNADAGNNFFGETKDYFHYLVNSALNYAIMAHTENEWKLPLLTLRYLVPSIGAILVKRFVNPRDRIVIYDKKTVEAFSENSLRAILAHEAGHIKNNDHAINNVIWNLSMCAGFATAYYCMTSNTAQSFLSSLSVNMYVLLHQLTNQFDMDLLRGHDQKTINKDLMQGLILHLFAENIYNLLYAKRSRYIEYRADIEAAHVVGFENMIKSREEVQRLLEPNAEHDFALIPFSDHPAVNFWIWLLKKSEQFKEWKTLNSPFRSHPTGQQRIDHLRQQHAVENQQAST